MASLGSLVNDALNGFQTAPYRLFIPAAVLALIIGLVLGSVAALCRGRWRARAPWTQ